MAYETIIGGPPGALDTPALCLDLAAVEANIAAMAGFLRGQPARLRPHAKTHKSPALAHMQLAMHAAPNDFIGPIFSAIATSSELGQFFTTPEVSELIARVTLADMPAKIADPRRKGPITLLETTCGVGGMI